MTLSALRFQRSAISFKIVMAIAVDRYLLGRLINSDRVFKINKPAESPQLFC
jgi:hypothetical protein